MAVLTTTIAAGKPYYRITTKTHADKRQVVSGAGAVKSDVGGRYSGANALTVYLTEKIDTCLAERMFYFYLQTIQTLDLMDGTGILPPFTQDFVLWEVIFKKDVSNIFDLKKPPNHTTYAVYPFLMHSPTQDYKHLKNKRGVIQGSGYRGLYAPSSRCPHDGAIIALFENQQSNVQDMERHSLQMRLLCKDGSPFSNPGSEMLDFSAGEARILGAAPSMSPYNAWQKIPFHR